MKHTEFNWRSTDGLHLYAQSWEPEDEPWGVVCLVHGLGEHSGRYAHVAEALAAAGYATMGMDLRGHGKSAGQRGHAASLDTLMTDINRLLDEAAAHYPNTPRFLYGHSLGGNLVIYHVLHNGSGRAEQDSARLAGATATSPVLRTTSAPPAVQLTLAKIMSRVWPTFSLPNGLEQAALSRDAAVVRAYSADPLVHDRISARLGLDMLQSGEWALAHAAELSLPLLLTHGSEDRLTSAKASQEFATLAGGNCTFKLWEGLYHETHNEPEKKQVIAFMIDWLRKHTPT